MVAQLTILPQALERQHSWFKFKAKWYCCKLIHEVPSLTEEFEIVVNTPFQTLQRLKNVAAQVVFRLYHYDTSGDNDVDLVRLKVFSQKTRDVKRFPRVMPGIYI